MKRHTHDIFNVTQICSARRRSMATYRFTGWLERQTGMVFNHMILLMQAEVERFHAGNLLLHDYYHTTVQDVAGDSVVLVSVALLLSEREYVGGAGCCSLLRQSFTSQRLYDRIAHSTAIRVYHLSFA